MNVSRSVFNYSMRNTALCVSLLCMLIDLDHIPYYMELWPEGRPLHIAWSIFALVSGSYGMGILKL